ncbi:MAG: hypothetical protein K0Q60_2663 [Microvirga sp.]|nr:hypothetical protein [Microvirga sp.]
MKKHVSLSAGIRSFALAGLPARASRSGMLRGTGRRPQHDRHTQLADVRLASRTMLAAVTVGLLGVAGVPENPDHNGCRLRQKMVVPEFDLG